MTSVSVDSHQARAVLLEAIRAAKLGTYKPSHRFSREISTVMLGTHLTYRYVLITSLLAKATNEKVNALAMQAGASGPGAFDARSLCHGVIVPADREAKELGGALGRSNEPYLNKPARYPLLALTNAVRRGNDRAILQTCIRVLTALTDREDARTALVDAIYFALKRLPPPVAPAEINDETKLKFVLTAFAQRVVSKSCEGESCAIIAGLSFHLIESAYGRASRIDIHPINQSGTSSREVLDIDVCCSQGLLHSAEVKDKLFGPQDVDHAATKAAKAGLKSFFFVIGPSGASSGLPLMRATIAKTHGVAVTFVDVIPLFVTCLGFSSGDTSAAGIWDFISKAMNSARVKDETRAHIVDCARRCGLASGD